MSRALSCHRYRGGEKVLEVLEVLEVHHIAYCKWRAIPCYAGRLPLCGRFRADVGTCARRQHEDEAGTVQGGLSPFHAPLQILPRRELFTTSPLR